MRKPPRHCHKLQLELFHPPRNGPEWRTLPVEVREQARQLLARMLRMGPGQNDAGERAASNE